MTAIRKFLVKHFVLSYTGNIFGWRFDAPRASRIIYPLMVITGWFSVTNTDWPTPTPFIWGLYGLLALSLWFGFPLLGVGYFAIWPPQWHDLDDLQKFQYGKFKSDELTTEQFREWTVIAERLYDEENG